MTKVLITGATGNVGIEVLKCLQNIDHQLDIIAAIRNTETDRKQLTDYKISFKEFDFTDGSTYKPALHKCDVLFLLRPPQITDIAKYFKPLIHAAKNEGVKHILFLSVQGVEKSRVIPHYKIEKLIVKSNIPYTFLRPAYFMQNFSTTLRHDLIYKKRIYLPAGHAKFTLIDVRDIGEVAARIIADPSTHFKKSYELTCNDKMTFKEIAKSLTEALGTKIHYESPSLFRFFLTKIREDISMSFILVMIMLHYLPRFQKDPIISDWVKKISGRQPTTFNQFVNDHKAHLQISK